MQRLFNMIIRFSFYGLAFLMPLFFTSWTFEALEFNKQYLLFLLVMVAFLSWLIKMIVIQKRIVFNRTPLDLLVLIFMTVMILATVFSIDSISSWLGFYGRFSDATIGLLSLIMMYFLIPQIPGLPSQSKSADELNQKKDNLIFIKRVLNLFLISAGLVVATAYLSIFELWIKPSWFGERLLSLMSLKTFNLVAGNLEGLSIFLVAIISLSVGMLLNHKKWILRILYFLLLIATTILLILIDFWAAWVVLGLTMLILLTMALWTQLFKKRVNVLILPIILVIISVIGVFVDFQGRNFPGLSTPSLPEEVILDYQIAQAVSWQSFKESPILGSGPGTWQSSFTRLKPVDFNQNRFWNIRFDKAPFHWLELIGAVGVLGVLSYFGVVAMFLLAMMMVFWRIVKLRKDPLKLKENNVNQDQFLLATSLSKNRLLFALFLPWIALLIAQFVYSQNTVLIFSFWLFMSLAVVSWREIQGRPFRKIGFSFKKRPEAGLVISTLLLVLIFVALGLFYFAGRFYWAEVKFNSHADSDKQLVENLEKAVNFNKYRADYRMGLSRAYLTGAWQEARKSEEERSIELLQKYAAGAITQAKSAVDINPKLISPQQNLAVVYRDLRGLVDGVEVFSIEAFKDALKLEPTNSFFYRELCRLSLMIEDVDWEASLNSCQKAVDLKPNYLDAHIQLALAYEKKGKLEEALKQLESALDRLKGINFERGSSLAGAATEIYFQIGRVRFNLNQIDEAVKFFEQAAIITPNYSNARYGLGIAYQLQGRNQDALQQFEIVSQLNPNNATVKERIMELELGEQLPLPAE